MDRDEVIDGLSKLARRGETGAPQRLPAQDTEPALHLIQPGRVGRDEVEVHMGVPLEPAILLGLLGV